MLCLMLVLGMATTAFADEATTRTITINNSTEGYAYEAYQIFSGTIVDNQLTNIAWGSNVDTEKIVNWGTEETPDNKTLIQALQANAAFADCTDAVAVAKVLGDNNGKDSDVAKAFADIVSKYLKGTASTSTFADSKYTITVPSDGYYLVKNTKVPDATDTTASGSYTRYILKVVGNVEVSHKGNVPSVEKKILEEKLASDGESKVVEEKDANTADIGDTIKYQLTGTMPSNIADYDTYYYVFTDTMSNGLTYTNNLQVKVNNVDVTDYFWSNNDSILNKQGQTLKVGIQDILSLESITGEITATTEVVVTYTALVNEDAQIGVDGETNEVELEFSNDPNNDGDGTNEPDDEPEEPTPTNPTGETPKDYVKTYTTEIKITKVDALDEDKILTGAKFSISGVSSNVVVVNKEMFVEAENGTYYRLKDGTYTTTAPVFIDEETTTEVDERNYTAYDLTEEEIANQTATKYKKV